jgi:hypothetical protein
MPVCWYALKDLPGREMPAVVQGLQNGKALGGHTIAEEYAVLNFILNGFPQV